MKRLLLLFILGCAGLASGTAFTSSQGGDWNTNATWGGGGHPGSGDTATILGHAITCAATCTVGTSGATGTLALTMHTAGGSLTINAGGTFNLQGLLDWTAGTITNSGTWNFATPAGSQYEIKATANTATRTLNCTGSAGTHAVFTTTGLGSNGWIELGANNAIAANIAFSYCELINIGDSTSGWSVGQGNCTTGQNCTSVTLSNVLVKNSATFEFSFGGTGTETISIDGISFVAPSTTFAFKFDAEASLTSGSRTARNITVYNESASPVYARMWMTDTTWGAKTGANPATCTVPSVYGYNVQLSTYVATNVTIECSGLTQDVTDGQQQVLFNSQNNVIHENSFSYNHYANAHTWAEAGGSNGGLAANQVRYNVVDGDSYWLSDTGDVCLPEQAMTCNYNILLNNAGTLFTTLFSTNRMTTDHNTLFNSNGGSAGENGNGALQMVSTQSNLVVQPFDLHATQSLKQGLVFEGRSTAYIRQSSWTVDYNAFYAMPGSGDTNAPPTATDNGVNLTNSTLSVVGYAAFPFSAISGLDSKTATAGTTTTIIKCTGCLFLTNAIPAQVGDFIIKLDATGGFQRDYCRIASVDSDTQVTCGTALGATPTTFDVRYGYMSSTTKTYGTSDFGLHDLHLASNPFTDSTKMSVATWATSIGVTATPQALGRCLVTLNGWDYTGAATTPVTTCSANAALTYIRAGATPTLSSIARAGHDGGTIGAIQIVSPGTQIGGKAVVGGSTVH